MNKQNSFSNKTIEALKMAIEAMQSAYSSHGKILLSYPAQDAWMFNGCDAKLYKSIEACKEALEKAEKREPVALIRHENGNFSPAPSWQSLSDNEIGKVLDDLDIGAAHTDWMINFAYAIEAKLKEKNKC